MNLDVLTDFFLIGDSFQQGIDYQYSAEYIVPEEKNIHLTKESQQRIVYTIHSSKRIPTVNCLYHTLFYVPQVFLYRM